MKDEEKNWPQIGRNIGKREERQREIKIGHLSKKKYWEKYNIEIRKITSWVKKALENVKIMEEL